MLKELGERLIEIERQELEEEKQEGQKEEGGACSHCGRKGHEESRCQFRTEIVREWRKKAKPTKKQDGKGSAAEAKPDQGSSLEPGPSTKKVSVIGIQDQTALHTPVWINGVKFNRCLIDTGSEVNLISVKDAIKHGFVYELAGIKKIRGFNGSSSFVDGSMECEIRLGPCGELHRVEFLVTSVATIPIIGCPTLADMAISVDCQERIL